MSPRINSGDKICIREIRKEDIIYGEIYALIIGEECDTRTVKWVTRSPEEGKIRLKLQLDEIGDMTGEAYIEHRYIKEVFEGTITLRKNFFYYRDMPQRKPLSDYAE